MTISLSYRIMALFMALTMILSSVSYSIDIHYCQDQMMGLSFFGKAKSCHEQQTIPPCHKVKKGCHHQSSDLDKAEKDNCCHNESIVIEKLDVDATSQQTATVQNIQLEFVAAYVIVYLLNYNVEADFQSFDQYKPPLPDRDVQVLYQTFLI